MDITEEKELNKEVKIPREEVKIPRLGKSRVRQIREPLKEKIEPEYSPLSTGHWFITFLISDIPVIGFICLLFWAFSKNTTLIKKEYCKARMLYKLVFIVIYIVLIILAVKIAAPYLDSLLARLQVM